MIGKISYILVIVLIIVSVNLYFEGGIDDYIYSGVVRQTGQVNADSPETEPREATAIIPVQNQRPHKRGVGPPGSAHHHQTFLVFLNGTQYNFGEEKYLGRSPFAHIHEWPFEIHTHATGVTLKFFFRTLNMSISKTCFVLDSEHAYCNRDGRILNVYVNGERTNEFGDHVTAPGEHYLITYGNETEEEIQIQNKKIPEIRSTINTRPVPEDPLEL